MTFRRKIVDQAWRRRILWIEFLGLAVLVAVSWLDETIMLPYHVLGRWIDLGGWHEPVFETIVAAIVMVPMMLFTSRLLEDLHYLEDFLRVCAWCKRIDADGKWLPMEDYFRHHTGVAVSHGVCGDCAVKMMKKKRALEPES